MNQNHTEERSMRKIAIIVAGALALLAASATTAGAWQQPGAPSCKPEQKLNDHSRRHDDGNCPPMRHHPRPPVMTPPPVITPPPVVTPPVVTPPTATPVTTGPVTVTNTTPTTTTVTVTVNGTPITITIPISITIPGSSSGTSGTGGTGGTGSTGGSGSSGSGSGSGSGAACVSTLKASTLGPLPARFRNVKNVNVRIHGKVQTTRVLPGRKVVVNLSGVPCGVYAIVVNDTPDTRAVQPVLRIWALTGGQGIQKAGFPLPDPPLGLS